jgi:hypothetical protein
LPNSGSGGRIGEQQREQRVRAASARALATGQQYVARKVATQRGASARLHPRQELLDEQRRSRTVKRPRIRAEDRIVWSWLSRHCACWRTVLVFVQPATVIAWQRKRFRDHWARLSGAGKSGRPRISEGIRQLIRTISRANPGWGTPRIVGELGKLSIEVAKSTVDKYRVRSGKTPLPTWKAFLENHLNDLVSIDFLIVPTIRFQLLYVFIVLAHSRRRVLHFNVTPNPTAQRTAQQIVEAFPWDSAPRYLLRDRDAIYGGGLGGGFTRWASSRCAVRHAVLGKIRSSNVSMAHCDATVSIM